MSSTTNIHPDAVLKALVAKSHRSNVKRTLMALHDLCRKHHEAGLKEFSVACIGRKGEEVGLFNSRTLYNPPSQIYRDLITAWAAYAGPPIPLPAKPLASNEYLLKIDDPAIRMIMQSIIAERDTLKAQINLIKGGKLGIIDLRPRETETRSSLEGDVTAILMPAAQLTDSERKALEAAVSATFLHDEGWFEGERGEIRSKKSNRVVFERGFTSAIRKLLGVEPLKNTKVVS